ncbi:hypothetical protein N0V85_004445 [Neurospora sp. IMI 360204]|nr:hypothetical protein N0V85_004445 [Neurospora sp. IMI 360204]
MTSETASATENTLSPKPVVNDRRKVQNRIAQRRFRQKKAMEAQAASLQAEGIWHEYFNLHPQYAANYELPYLGPSAPTGPTDVPQRGWYPTIEYQTGVWDNQFFGSDDFYLSSPPADIVALMSPPNSSASSVSPDGLVYGGEIPNKTPCFPLHDQDGYPVPMQQDLLFRDGMFPAAPFDVNGSVPGAPHHSFSNEATHGDNTDVSALDYAENVGAQLRYQVATEWEMHRPAQSIDSSTWASKDGEQWEPLLHTAANNGNCGIMQMLLDHNTENSQEDVIMLLLQRDVDVNVEDNSYWTALSGYS